MFLQDALLKQIYRDRDRDRGLVKETCRLHCRMPPTKTLLKYALFGLSNSALTEACVQLDMCVCTHVMYVCMYS
jgi:hypothetical protein